MVVVWPNNNNKVVRVVGVKVGEVQRERECSSILSNSSSGLVERLRFSSPQFAISIQLMSSNDTAYYHNSLSSAGLTKYTNAFVKSICLGNPLLDR